VEQSPSVAAKGRQVGQNGHWGSQPPTTATSRLTAVALEFW